jgi:hypothetical protein
VIGLEDDLGIAAGKEAVALVLQLAAQLAKIIDATIKGNGEAKLRVNHRLLGGFIRVKNIESAMAERDSVLQKQSTGIGPARRERPAHGGDRRGAGLRIIKSNFAADPAHIEWSILLRFCARILVATIPGRQRHRFSNYFALDLDCRVVRLQRSTRQGCLLAT